jgi:hypothetical protein
MATITAIRPADQSTTPLAADRALVRETIASVVARAKAVMDPRLHGRIDQAQRLCLNGDVTRHADGTGTVGSQSDGAAQYHINGRCDCRDADKAPGQWCKHRLALAILARTEQALAIADAELARQAPAPTPSRPTPSTPGFDNNMEPWDDQPEPAAVAQTPAPTADMALLAPYITLIHGKKFVQYAGLLALAHHRGLRELAATITVHLDGVLAIAEATALFADGRRFTESGDATPGNVSATVRPHFIRCALTRAKSRVLRDALGIDMVAVEELD